MKTSFSLTSSPELFDQAVRYIRECRYSAQDDFITQHVSKRLHERLKLVKRTFDHVALLGNYQYLAKFLSQDGHGYSGVYKGPNNDTLSLEAESLNLILAMLNLQWVNDLPGYLWRIRSMLQPDMLFIGTLLGGETLKELRASLLNAELQISGGASPRVIPMIDLYTASQLLMRANFALPVADREIIKVSYPSLAKLIQDLRLMGLTNPMYLRNKSYPGKKLFKLAEDYYHKNYSNNENKLIATFEVIYLTGWSHHENQQKALKPGSAKLSLRDFLK